MEGVVELGKARQVGGRTALLVNQAGEFGSGRLRGGLGAAQPAHRAALQRQAHLEEVGGFARRDRYDDRAPPGQQVEQVLGRQTQEGLVHRGPAHAELRRDLDLAQQLPALD
jgi:hypothetical protein